jgi:hypothetical protein
VPHRRFFYYTFIYVYENYSAFYWCKTCHADVNSFFLAILNRYTINYFEIFRFSTSP